jgi:hypothetical protein
MDGQSESSMFPTSVSAVSYLSRVYRGFKDIPIPVHTDSELENHSHSQSVSSGEGGKHLMRPSFSWRHIMFAYVNALIGESRMPCQPH